jgi:hypothetical protein
LIIVIILGEEYMLWSSSLCSFLQPPVTWYLFGPNIFLQPFFSSIALWPFGPWPLSQFLNDIHSR